MKRRQFLTGTLGASILFGCSGSNSRLGSPDGGSGGPEGGPDGANPDAGSASDGLADASALGPTMNILVILVDEMRPPPGFPDNLPANWASALPNMSALWAKSACFSSHFTSASDCSPSRATLVTGLYAQQHYLLTTRTGNTSPQLETAYPTFGTALTALGYDTTWLGKWHLSNVGTSCSDNPLAAYGFAGGTCPDPIGTANQGASVDPQIADQFVTWLGGRSSSGRPWCTTVSFVNPHDIQWFWTGSDCGAAGLGRNAPESDPPVGSYDSAYFAQFNGNPCANFENPSDTATPKPAMQPAFAAFTAQQVGAVSWDIATLEASMPAASCPSSSSDTKPFNYWYKALQLYLDLQNMVDQQIGRVLAALGASPFAGNTLVIFTSDHGEYAGAHGQRGKGGMAYDEGMRVPLTIYDPSGSYVTSAGTVRAGLTSSADFAPLLMTLANRGSPSLWSSPSGSYGYLSGRFDLSTMLRNPTAPGRSYVLYSTDEVFPGIPTSVAAHVLSYRTADGKLSVYSHWTSGAVTIDTTQGQDFEVYDYGAGDALEMSNVAPTSALTSTYMTALFGSSGTSGLVASELHAPLPASMASAQATAIANYVSYAPVATARF